MPDVSETQKTVSLIQTYRELSFILFNDQKFWFLPLSL